MDRTRYTLSLVLVALALIFALQNTQVVEVRLLFWTLSMSQVLLIFLLLAVGALVGWAAAAYRHRPRR